MVERFSPLLICVSAVALVACGGGGSGSDTDTSPRTATAGSATAADPGAIEGSFDVGGRKLYLECHGRGSLTVVCVHDYNGARTNSGLIPDLLDDRYRVCMYDRANVGDSDPVPGPHTGKDSVKDLHALLAVADVPGPYVLVGSRFGGLIASMYATTYPDEVVGMVLLNGSLPDDLEIEKRFFPKDERLTPDDWKSTSERFDRFTTYHQAQAIEGSAAQVPVTYLGSKPLPPSWPTETKVAIRKAQRAFVDRFSPGRLILVESPYYMEPIIPERIAHEVEQVIKATKQT